MDRRQMAVDLFLQGYNCAQSLAGAFADVTGLDRDTMLRLASSFGGGMGRLREVCGGVTGSLMVLSMVYGYSTPETGEAKAQLYARVQALAKAFEAEHGTILCRELLGRTREEPTPEARTPAYYASRPCARFIGDAAELLERYLNEHPVRQEHGED